VFPWFEGSLTCTCDTVFLRWQGQEVLAKIAVESDERRTRKISRLPESRLIASGDGWTVSDIVCTAGPRDRPFEEGHTQTSIAIVVGGTFQYRSSTGRDLMTPGSCLLGNPGDSFTCGHDHGTGDRCVAFSYVPEFFDRLAYDAWGRSIRFKVPRLPPIRALAPLVARASTILAGDDPTVCEELSIRVAARAIEVAQGVKPSRACSPLSSWARVARVVRMIENEEDVPQDLNSLALVARLSPYHFLRTFEEVTGTTPHQYLIRVRLRRAAIFLRSESTRISDIALRCGFGDISNFNRTFRAEFGVAPRTYRSMV
jgi:AraC family transcriptional regulator